MDKEQKIVAAMMWGVGAVIGLTVANKVRDMGVRYYDKRKAAETIEEIHEVESE